MAAFKVRDSSIEKLGKASLIILLSLILICLATRASNHPKPGTAV